MSNGSSTANILVPLAQIETHSTPSPTPLTAKSDGLLWGTLALMTFFIPALAYYLFEREGLTPLFTACAPSE